MRSGRIISIMLMLAAALLVLGGCNGGGADITLPPEDDTSSEVRPQQNAYCFVYNNTSVTPGAKMAELQNGLGEPVSYEESPSCLYQGLDKDYTYHGFKLRTYPENGIDHVLNICFTDDSVQTPEGITLGSALEEVVAAYGSGFTEENGSTVYTKDKTELRFRFSDGCVIAVEYWAITD